jgi:hexosaminidase
VVEPAAGELFLTPDTTVVVDARAAAQAADLLRSYLTPATGLELPDADADGDGDGDSEGPVIRFDDQGAEGLGDEEYELRIDADGVEVVAATPAGFGWAVQTIRQLLPAEIEGTMALPGTWTLPAGRIHDVPYFAWRGVMVDVVRHFFPPADIERVIDLAALYKLNRLHLHLTNDQGWRLQIEAYPELTEVGGSTEMGGGPGGFYTQDEYRQLVDYAAVRGIVVVPEIDMPGHVTAALAARPELVCSGSPVPEVETGYSVFDNSLCVDDPSTYDFVQQVLTEVAALTPGPYIHIGGDEAEATSPELYPAFITRVTAMVQALGKQPVGWEEIATADLPAGAIVQHWRFDDPTVAAAAQGAGIVLSPATHAYMDMKYDESTPLGLSWAGYTDTQDAYEWEPTATVPGLPAESVLGLEAPLWTETVTDLAEMEQMLLPRLPGYAELGWSSPDGRSWDEYRWRVAAHAARWNAAGLTYTRDPSVPWSE